MAGNDVQGRDRELSKRDGGLRLIALTALAGLGYLMAELTTGDFKSPLLHFITEAFSAVVGVGVAWLAVRSFRQTGSTRVLCVASAFLFMGILDVFHGLAFAEMPQTFLPIGTNQQLFYWIPSRVVGALILLASAVLPNKQAEERKRQWMERSMLGAAVASAFVIVAIAATTYGTLPPFYIEGSGLTPLKMDAEFLVIALLAVTSALYWGAFVRNGRELTAFFTGGLLLLVLSEVTFVLYHTPWEAWVWLGHGLRVLAYGAFGLGIARLGIQPPGNGEGYNTKGRR